MSTFPLSLRQRRTFVDSAAYLALLDQGERYHREAVAVLYQLVQGRYRQFTTNCVLIEAHALLLSRLGIARAAQFLRDITAGNTVVIRARAADEAAAQSILFRQTDKDYSFTDAISFVVMERLSITHAFTLDHHFEQYGFTVPPTLLR